MNNNNHFDFDFQTKETKLFYFVNTSSILRYPIRIDLYSRKTLLLFCIMYVIFNSIKSKCIVET